jgi:hypothetical protein
MPMGKGTYGSKVGRPPKKKAKAKATPKAKKPMNKYRDNPKAKNMTSVQKAMLRERIINKAAGMNAADRKKYIETLRKQGITPSSIGVGSNLKLKK